MVAGVYPPPQVLSFGAVVLIFQRLSGEAEFRQGARHNLFYFCRDVCITDGSEVVHKAEHCCPGDGARVATGCGHRYLSEFRI